MTEPRFIECILACGGGTSTRAAIACTVAGSALTGPTSFPGWKPEVHAGERAVWRRGRWYIVTRKRRGGARLRLPLLETA